MVYSGCLICPNSPPNGHQRPFFEPYFKGIFLIVGCVNIDAVHSLTTHRDPDGRSSPRSVMHPTGKASHLTGLPKTICPQTPGEHKAPRGFNLSGADQAGLPALVPIGRGSFLGSAGAMVLTGSMLKTRVGFSRPRTVTSSRAVQFGISS